MPEDDRWPRSGDSVEAADPVEELLRFICLLLKNRKKGFQYSRPFTKKTTTALWAAVSMLYNSKLSKLIMDLCGMIFNAVVVSVTKVHQVTWYMYWFYVVNRKMLFQKISKTALNLMLLNWDCTVLANLFNLFLNLLLWQAYNK